MKDKKIKVIHYGLGPIGISTAKLALNKSNLEIVGAVDISKEMFGKDLGNVLKLGKNLGISVANTLALVLEKTDADIVIHSTHSRLNKIFPQLKEIIEVGLNVVSSAEELLFPLASNIEFAKKINSMAEKNGVTVLSTGVNPGFVMDALPIFLTGVCHEVKEIHVRRIVDARTRRYPLQKKIGAGMAPDVFREKIKQKALGHVGLLESLYLIANRLHISLDEVIESIEPIIAEKPVKTDYFSLKQGDVAGIKHSAEAIKAGHKVITLDLRMYVGADDPHDAVFIKGIPDVNLRIDGGIPGDQATAAILVNSIPSVIEAKPGLITVKDIPAPYCSF